MFNFLSFKINLLLWMPIRCPQMILVLFHHVHIVIQLIIYANGCVTWVDHDIIIVCKYWQLNIKSEQGVLPVNLQ